MSTVMNTPRVAGAGDAGGARLRVPWGTVLPLAVVAAFGTTFWIIAIRGAVGSVERASAAPFPTWLRESTLQLPLYVFAVLGALTLALRWFRDRQRTRATVSAFLLVVAAASVVGTVVLVANTVYDYHLQAAHLKIMNATHEACNAVCSAAQLHDAFVVQVRAVVFGSALILVTNLVLLGLLVAFRGGKLDIASVRRASERVRRFDNVELFLLAGLLGAAVVHATVVAEQLALWPAAGIALLVLIVAEVDVALLFLLRLRSMQYVAAAVVSAVPLLVWLVSRTVGLPFGPDAGVPQQVGLTDAALALLQAATLVVAVVALRSRRRAEQGSERAARPSTSQHAARLALAGVVAVSGIGLAGGLGLLATSGASSHAHHTARNGPPTIVYGSNLKSVNPNGR